MKPVTLLGLLTLIGLLLLGWLGALPASYAAGAGLAPVRPAQSRAAQGRTPYCDPGTPCDTPTATATRCIPGQTCPPF